MLHPTETAALISIATVQGIANVVEGARQRAADARRRTADAASARLLNRTR